MWFAIFFEKALVSRVNRRLPMRMLRFERSTIDVLTFFKSGLPFTMALHVLTISGGL